MKATHDADADQEKLAQIDTLVQRVWAHPTASFYRALWKQKPPVIDSLETLRQLPPVSWETFKTHAFAERSYSDTAGSLIKIVYRDDKPLLFGRTHEDIAQEYFGVESNRPLMLFSSTHETLEKSIWQYEQNRLPLLCTPLPEITAQLATLYEIDGIVCDMAALKAYLPAIVQKYDRANIKNVVIIDETFDTEFLHKQFPESEIHCVFSLPEVGTVGVAKNITIGTEPVFNIEKNAVVEIDEDGTLIVSRTLILPFPIVRYETGSRASWHSERHTAFVLVNQDKS